MKQVVLGGDNSSPKPTATNSSQGISGSVDQHSSVEKPATLPKEFCTIKSQDALSAIQRAKTEECRNHIRNITCLDQNDKLYNTQIRNMCPIGRDPGKIFQSISYDKGQGPLPRVVFLLSMHGRAFRQVRRLFKAIYHEDHYFILHIDSVRGRIQKQSRRRELHLNLFVVGDLSDCALFVCLLMHCGDESYYTYMLYMYLAEGLVLVTLQLIIHICIHWVYFNCL